MYAKFWLDHDVIPNKNCNVPIATLCANATVGNDMVYIISI